MRLARLAALLLLALVLTACGGTDEVAEEPEPTTTAATTEATAEETAGEAGACETVESPPPRDQPSLTAPNAILDATTTYRLVVDTNCGPFTIELDLESAPETTASLVALAREGFFDGTTFHRVVPGFVIQGGDPTGTGGGGPGYSTVDAPPSDATYTSGVVAMAKTGTEPPGTAGSQFFVVTGGDIGLPADYAIVGRVVEGMENVLLIDALGVGDGPPSQAVVIQEVTVEEA